MALKALEMDDSLAEAHTSLAYARWLGDLDWVGAEREFKRALELKSSYVMAHEWYAEYLAALGRHDEALAAIKRAQQLDPLSVPVNRAVGWVVYFSRRYDQAIEELRKTLGMDPSFLGARLVLWWALLAKGAHDEAIADIRKEVERPGLRTMKKLMLGYACALSGRLEEAGGILWELQPKIEGENRLALLAALLFTRWTTRIGRLSSWNGHSRFGSPDSCSCGSRPGPTRFGPTGGTCRWWSGWASADEGRRQGPR